MDSKTYLYVRHINNDSVRILHNTDLTKRELKDNIDFSAYVGKYYEYTSSFKRHFIRKIECAHFL